MELFDTNQYITGTAYDLDLQDNSSKKKGRQPIYDPAWEDGSAWGGIEDKAEFKIGDRIRGPAPDNKPEVSGGEGIIISKESKKIQIQWWNKLIGSYTLDEFKAYKYEKISSDLGNQEECDRWNPEHFDSSPDHKADGDQLTIFLETGNEPPDPDDFKSIAEYEEAWKQWEISNSLICAQESASDFHLPESKREDFNLSDLQKPMTTAQAFLKSDSQESPILEMSRNLQPSVDAANNPILLPVRRPVSRSVCRERGSGRKIPETASPQLSGLLSDASQPFSPSKMLEDCSIAPSVQERKNHILDFSSTSFPGAGMMSNGKLFPAEVLERPSLESGSSWLESPGALSSVGRSPGLSRLESSLVKRGILIRGQVVNPTFLEESFGIPQGWTNPLECRPATELLESDEQHSEMHLIQESQRSPSEEFSTSTHSSDIDLAKQIFNRFKEELGGFTSSAELSESEIQIVEGIGACHYHIRKDDQVTIRKLAILPEYQRQGWGRLLIYRVLCRAIEEGKASIFLKCPRSLAANDFYKKFGFNLEATEPGKKQSINHWRYSIKLPLLFYCGSGGISEFDQRAQSAGWKLGLRSCGKYKAHQHMAMIDNEWKNYDHAKHLETVRRNKPLLCTARDIEQIEQLPEILEQARELAQYAGRVLLIPKCRIPLEELPENYWLAYSVPSAYGGTELPPSCFNGSKPVHLLGGSPKKQAQLAPQMNVVSLDANYAMKLAQSFGKSVWSDGIRNIEEKAEGCYSALESSLIKQFQYWRTVDLQRSPSEESNTYTQSPPSEPELIPENFSEEVKKDRRRGCLYKYLENKKLKDGVIASYPRVAGERDPDNPKHWRWGFNWEEKIDGQWKNRSLGCVPVGAIPMIESMQKSDVPLQEIIDFIRRSKRKIQ